MNIETLKELHGTDGNEACHAFWDKCGTELIALIEAVNEKACDHGKPSDNEGGLETSCRCEFCRAVAAFNLKFADFP